MKSSTTLVARILLGTSVALGALALVTSDAQAHSRVPVPSRAGLSKIRAIATPSCAAGYRAAGGLCVDIDECAEGTAEVCGKNQVCSNRPGYATCDCAEGYEWSPTKTCVLVDGDVVDHLKLPDDGGGIPVGGGDEDGGCGTDDGAGGEGAGGGDAAGGGDSDSDSDSSNDEDEDEEHTIVVTDTEGLCSASPTGGANPSALATLFAVGAVLVARRRKA